MLKALGWLLKLSLFSIVILIAGEWLRWDGKTLSQHIRAQVAHAEHSSTAAYVRETARHITDDARVGIGKKMNWGSKGHALPSEHGAREKNAAAHEHEQTLAAVENDAAQENEITDQTQAGASAPKRPTEQIAPSERQKLRALIRELNSSHD